MEEAGEAGRRAESGGIDQLFCIDEAVSTDLLEAVMWRMVCGEQLVDSSVAEEEGRGEERGL